MRRFSPGPSPCKSATCTGKRQSGPSGPSCLYNPVVNQQVFAAVADALERGEPAALVTIVSARGSTPQRVGAKMLVFADGRIVGTIGGGCYENDAFWKAREAITSRRPALVHYELDDDFAQETGLICGGQMDVYIEPIEPSPELYVIGAGHVGFHLARVAHEVGFRVHVVDDREKFANRERFPDAVEIVVDDIPAWIGRAHLPPHAYAVIVTRGHTNDLEALRALAPLELRYLGLIGSRAKVARIYDALVADQMPPDTLTRVHAPIGIDIGAVTPQEIAVSILAELIAVKHGKVTGRDGAGQSMKWEPPKLVPAKE
jgi:xanthine dehydrogenase accessory factor